MLRTVILSGLLVVASAAGAEPPPLLKTSDAEAIASQVSGGAAKRTVEALSLNHRMRGSQGYRRAAELIRSRLEDYGLAEASIIALPADGKIFYGTQRSRPAWNANFAELWEHKQNGGRWIDAERIASWKDQPITLAQDSVSGTAIAPLVNVGAGTSDSDYAGKDVRGKLVLTSSQPETIAKLAVTKYGAAGIVSWAQNQKSAWWGEDESLIRWGHLDTWKDPTFAFMVSPARAHAWQERLQKGEVVQLRAAVQAGRSPGEYLIPTAVIPGRDRTKEILYSCHLDHPSPGANDNASGCAGILEVARTLNRLVKEGPLPQPERTLRFIWPCEVECTISLLNARPEFAERTLAAIHLDMIGGRTETTKGVLRVEGSPPSSPSFVDDVAFALTRWVNRQTFAFADSGSGDWPLIDPEGTRDALQAKVGGFSEGSDHQVWAEGSWRTPIIYVSDWPDRYIHTNRDVPENLDATKMKRAIFIAAASGWYLANVRQDEVPVLAAAMENEALERKAAALRSPNPNAVQFAQAAETEEAASLARFGLVRPQSTADAPPAHIEGLVYRRKPNPKGPMTGFGYSWLDDQLEKAKLPRPKLLDREAPRDGPSFAYEALNLVDGNRSVQDIGNQLTATVGPVPIAEVADFLATLQRVGLLEAR
ncbi:M28 family peptidase [Sphingomonas daechungensis]|uniref:M28 family peptidase n=1 Tax=Sphingomonas daechungensis TaxID=1176646 RepID=UPI0037836089